MATILKGFNEKQGHMYNQDTGKWDGAPFHSYEFFLQDEQTGKWEYIKSVPKRVIDSAGIIDLNACVGTPFLILYNKYGKVEKVTVA